MKGMTEVDSMINGLDRIWHCKWGAALRGMFIL